MKIFINCISYYLPETTVKNEDLVKEFPEWSVDKIADKIGVSERHVCATDETAVDLATKSGEKLFEENPQLKKTDIDFVILCTQSPDYFLPTSACIVQHKLGLRTDIGAFDFNLGCSGYVYGLSIAKGLICSGVATNVLLITSETYSKHIHPKDKGNRTIFGDAASASIISTNGFAEIRDFSLGTDGRGAGNLIVKSGAMRHKDAFNDLSFDENSNPKSSDYLFMDGSEIFNFTMEAVPLLVKDTLTKNNFVQDDIDLFVFHQANKYMMNFIRKKIKIDEQRFYYCMTNFGNTVSSTIPIALKEAMLDNSIKPNYNVLITGFGVGYSWGGVVLKF
jgi:3-oxoacyl-[acyl-carrier-protein] synthase III